MNSRLSILIITFILGVDIASVWQGWPSANQFPLEDHRERISTLLNAATKAERKSSTVFAAIREKLQAEKRRRELEMMAATMDPTAGSKLLYDFDLPVPFPSEIIVNERTSLLGRDNLPKGPTSNAHLAPAPSHYSSFGGTNSLDLEILF